jgi:hypothetical protein
MLFLLKTAMISKPIKNKLIKYINAEDNIAAMTMFLPSS